MYRPLELGDYMDYKEVLVLSTALRTVTDCAKKYRDNLVHKNLLYVYGSSNNKEYIETYFLPSHYLHLTGLKYNGSALKFYYECIEDRLSIRDISYKDESTSQKLMVLSPLVNIHQTVNIIGDYDGNRQFLITNKLAGTISACMGFNEDTDNPGYYYPNTALRENIKNLSVNTKRVIAVYRKMTNDDKYTERTYLASNITPESLTLPKEIQDKLDDSLIPFQ